MNSLFDFKDKIRGFVIQNLDRSFKTVYWQSERAKVPKKPYCLLTELSETQSMPTSENQLEGTLKTQVTMYKTAIITIAVYVDGTIDYDERKAFAYSSINNLRSKFEMLKTHYEFKKLFAIKSTTAIRPLNEVVNGGYLFRYEFDLTIGFNETFEYEMPVSQKVIIDLEDTQIEVPEVIE